MGLVSKTDEFWAARRRAGCSFPACGCRGSVCQVGFPGNVKPPSPAKPKQRAFLPDLAVMHGKPCPYCGEGMDVMSATRYPSRDHVYPRSRGGHDVASNILISCAVCNELKGSCTLVEFYFELREASDPRAEHVGRLLKVHKELAVA